MAATLKLLFKSISFETFNILEPKMYGMSRSYIQKKCDAVKKRDMQNGGRRGKLKTLGCWLFFTCVQLV